MSDQLGPEDFRNYCDCGVCMSLRDARGLSCLGCAEHHREIKRLRTWVDDLQRGAYINCVYCGHRYGPNQVTPHTMSKVLTDHIEKCPEHPLSKAREITATKNKALFGLLEIIALHAPDRIKSNDPALVAARAAREL